MGMPLGQYLLTLGAITPAQLKVALEAQILWGGRLGFNLVDLGYLSPGALSEHLGQYFGVPAADPAAVAHARPEAVRAVPRDVAIRYRALPLSMDRSGITVAMSDPTDLKAVEEIAFATGRSIKVVAAPEFLVKKGLEYYYEVPTSAEFYRPAAVEKLARIRAGLEGVDQDAVRVGRADGAEDVDFGALAENHYTPAWPDLRTAATPPDEGLLLGRRLASARRRDDVGHALLRFTRSWFSRAALFRLHGARARGWMGDGEGIDARLLRRHWIPVSGGLVGEALLQRALVHEPLGADDADRALAAAVGGGTPRTALLAPLFPRRGRIVILYADAGAGRPALVADQAARVGSLERALRKTEVALELVVVRRWLLWK
jgi:hypothetical protein